jgi:GNAT superfamily N-acetyltransferase
MHEPRDATDADLEALLDVQERANAAALGGVIEPLPLERWRERWVATFRRGRVRFRVVEADGQIVAVSMLQAPWLHSLLVVPEMWGTGVADALRRDAEAIIGEATGAGMLRVVAANARAVRFWSKHGWEDSGMAEAHQDPPHPPVLVFMKSLTPRSA